jgi:MFS family permease
MNVSQSSRAADAAAPVDTAEAGASPALNRGIVFVVVALPLLMMSIDSTIVATVLHALQHGLGTSIDWAGWTLTAYSFGFVLMLPLSGKLSRQYGRRRVFLASVVVFTAASLLCGMTDNIFVLIALRALQAAGGAGFTPSATGLIVDYFGDARDRAVSLFGSIFPIGAMIGPIFGGLFVTYWTWRVAFLVNAPIGVAVIILALRFIPADPPLTRAAPGLDIAGMALIGCGLFAAMLAATLPGEGGVFQNPLLVAALLVVALASAWGFFHHIGHTARPFIMPGFIHGQHFGPVNLVNMIYGGVTIGAAALIPFYAANRYGIRPFEAGTLLIAQGIATIAFSVTIALQLRRTGHRRPIYVGGTVIAIGMLMLAAPPIGGIPPYLWLAAAAALIGGGGGALNPATRNAGLQLAPDQSSTLAALRTLSLQIGTIATISISTAVLASTAAPGGAQAWIYVATAILLLVALPIVSRVPEHFGKW